MSETPDHSGYEGPPPQRPPEPVPLEARRPEPVVAEPRTPDPPLEVEPVETVAPVLAEAEAPSEPPTEPIGPEPSEPRTGETLGLPPTTGEFEAVKTSQPEGESTLAGVPVPFAAPPTERNGGRFAAKLVLGICGGFVLIVGTIVALVVAMIMFTNSYLERIESTAEDFMADLSEERWDDAYDRLCPDLRERPVEDYVDEWSSWETDDVRVGQIRDDMSGTFVRVEMGDGSTMELRLVIDQQSTSIEPTICGWEQGS